MANSSRLTPVGAISPAKSFGDGVGAYRNASHGNGYLFL